MTHPMSMPWLDWKPINTAPRDAVNWILLYGPDCQEPFDAAKWSHDSECWMTSGGEVWEEGKPFGPTMWASIPLPQS